MLRASAVKETIHPVRDPGTEMLLEKQDNSYLPRGASAEMRGDGSFCCRDWPGQEGRDPGFTQPPASTPFLARLRRQQKLPLADHSAPLRFRSAALRLKKQRITSSATV